MPERSQPPHRRPIALNARDAGLTPSVSPPTPIADLRLVEVRIDSRPIPPGRWAGVAAALTLPSRPRNDAPGKPLTMAERSLLSGFRAIPLFHPP